MTALAIGQPEHLQRHIAIRSQAVPLLQLFVVTLMVFPSDSVLKAVGGGGYVAALISYCLLLAWMAAVLFGIHNPFEYRHPVRVAVCMMWLVSLASYVLIDRAILTSTEQTGADRWLLQLAGVSGVILLTAEGLRSVDDLHRVLRALIWGGAFCGVVAALQFWLRIDITPYLRMLPGFSENQAESVYSDIISRGGLNRVVGTAIDPIELGVVAGMLLPIAVYLAMHDVSRPKWQRWFPVICITLSTATSVSRSAILSAVLALGVLLVSLPPARRLIGLAGIVVATAGIFLTAHGLIGTLDEYFFAGTSDSSITHRLNNYPYVEQLVREAPWFGQGGGTYIPASSAHIFDNEYLTTAVQLGLVGLAALVFFLLWPALAAFVARGRTNDPGLRDLCAALAGSELAAVLCSGTFDSLSFPMFVNVQALVAGLIGAVWLLVGRSSKTVLEARSNSNGIANSRHRASAGVIDSSGGN